MNDNTEDFADRIIITTMEQEIKKLGNQKCYSIIQNLSDPKVRVRYLHYFLRAGGFVPETDLFIEKEGKIFLQDNGGEKENEKL
jgi:hypothetical protein